MGNVFSWKKRYSILAILFTAWMISYLDRMVMATAIPFIAKEWDLSPMAMGVVMSAFFGGYALAQIPGGILADKFGSRLVSVFALIWWSIFTGVTGLVNSLAAMVPVRILFGLGEGLFPPCSYKSVSVWFPTRERGLAQAWMVSSNALGPAIAPLFVVAVMGAWGWRAVFYSLVIPGILISFLIWRYIRDNPAEYQGISSAELEEIADTGASQAVTEGKPMSFFETLSIEAVWKVFLVLITYNVALWGFSSWLPSYLVQAKGLSLARMGIEASLPFIAGTVGLVAAGWVSDKFFRNNRKTPIILGQVLGAVSLYLMFTVTDSSMATIYRTVAGFFFFWGLGAIMPLPLAVVPRQAMGRAFGIINTGGQIAGFASPIIIGYILEMSGSNYNIAFGFLAGCALISACIAAMIKQTK